MRREDLGDLLNLLAVVEEGGFSRAAAKLGVSQSALSHAVRRLEERHGVRLLARTTRSVALTRAGERLLETIRPAFAEIAGGLDALARARDRPAGSLRITASEHAARTVLWPAANRIAADYPDIRIEIDAESGWTDIVAERFDAGVRLGESLAKDMIAVCVGPPLRMAVVASPAYFAARGRPQDPHELAQHACINLRLASAGGFYAWEFSRAGRDLKVRVEGQLAFNRSALALEAARAGRGVAFVIEDQAADDLAAGTLARALEDWCEPFDGYHLYFPSRRQQSPALALLIEALRWRGG
ncbi:MAG: LysR family transcriptional regulator [Pseudomonadota bacterium]|nr:LysR family transcriptional regulator [Pseudomonadota bacterium]